MISDVKFMIIMMTDKVLFIYIFGLVSCQWEKIQKLLHVL